MFTYLKTGIPLLLLLLFSNARFVTTENLKYSGAATDIKSNIFYYTEEHEELLLNGKHALTKINYVNKEGQQIASKMLDYSTGYTTPSFRQEDFRNGHQEIVDVKGDHVKILYKECEGKPVRSKSLHMKEKYVVDGGFNYFIKNNWQAIMEEEYVRFNFVVPSQLDYYGFRIRKDKEGIVNNKKVIVLVMESDNFLIRALISPVILTYDQQTHRLVKYEGISNISNNNGSNYVVKITYPTVGP